MIINNSKYLFNMDPAIKSIVKEPKIFCVGLSKTGTTSFGQAMVELGYKHKTGGGYWQMDNNGLMKLIDLINEYQSFDDLPWPFYFLLCDHICENAKFILTTRASSAIWIDSMKRHFDFTGPKRITKYFYGEWMPHGSEVNYVNEYTNHNETVRTHFDGSGKFLECCWEQDEPWEKLCKFLGKQIPINEFPHGKKRKISIGNSVGNAEISKIQVKYLSGNYNNMNELVEELDCIAEPKWRVNYVKSQMYAKVGEFDLAVKFAKMARTGSLKGRVLEIENNLNKIVKLRNRKRKEF